ncbi:hypothetical protein J14TS2_31950 [Bacillus sp. J14TS2]|uniref:hypothetical protein n=1 Tax=Bacillus sp. J14TS2 TaxID=2807188 RepID=UPI001B09586F|nr:hypothetical protein [Bacillus sp. J14TS2]GIN72720.1 hypothetical protein J14TS2_31950 [Bacillus sp. J14TS2]
MRVMFNPVIKWLLVNQSNEKVRMEYLQYSWPTSVIARRPPYYTNPQYEPYYSLVKG